MGVGVLFNLSKELRKMSGSLSRAFLLLLHYHL